MEDIWKDIEGYEGLYQVSNLGRVKSLERLVTQRPGVTYTRPEQIIKHNSGAKLKGYPNLNLCRNGRVVNALIHRLVAQAFIPNPDNKRCINHIDGDKNNFKISNIEWVTHSENTKHAFRTGLQKQNYVFGTGHGMSKLDDVSVRVIREAYAENKWSYQQIANYFKMGQAAIRNIVIKRTWKHV